MGTQLLLIISKSRVVSDSYRLELHDDHPTRMTGVLQGPLTNCFRCTLDQTSSKNSSNC